MSIYLGDFPAINLGIGAVDGAGNLPAFRLPLISDLNYVQPIQGREITRFDGVDDYIDLGAGISELGIDETYSAVIWFRTGNDVTNTQVLFTNTNSSSSRTAISIISGIIRFSSFNSSSWANGLRSGSIDTDTLYCAIFTANGTTREIYLNNIQQTGNLDPGGVTSSVNGFRLGKNTSSNFGFNGEIYQAQFYNRVLTAQERTTIFNTGQSQIPIQEDFIASYNLQTSAGFGKNNVLDLSGNGYFGTSIGRNVFTRSTIGTLVDYAGLVRTADIDIPRFEGVRKVGDDYFETTASGLPIPELTKKGILIEEQRTNIINYSESFGDAVWTELNVTVTENDITSPDGNLTGTKLLNNSTGTNYLLQPYLVTSGESYSQSIYVKAGNTDYVSITFGSSGFGTGQYAIFNLSEGIIDTELGGTAVIKELGDGWYRCFWTASATSSTSTAVSIITPSRSGAGRVQGVDGDYVYIWGAQSEEAPFSTSYIKTEASSVIRNKDICNYEVDNLLNQAENLLLHSEDMGTAPWAPSSNAIVTVNQAISPSGDMDADQIEAGADGSVFITQNFNFIQSNVYTQSLYVKGGNTNFVSLTFGLSAFGVQYAIYNLSNGTVDTVSGGNASIEDVGNGWYRCIFTDNATATITSASCTITPSRSGADRITSVDGDYVYVWGAQLEERAYESRYLPTTTTALTDGRGSLYCEFNYMGIDSTTFQHVLSLDDGTTSNRLRFYYNSSGASWQFSTTNADSSDTNLSLINQPDPNLQNKFCVTYDNDNVNIYLNGFNVGSDNTVNIPNSLNSLKIAQAFNGANQLNGNVKDVRYYSEPLDELRAKLITESIYLQNEDGSIIFDENGNPIIKGEPGPPLEPGVVTPEIISPPEGSDVSIEDPIVLQGSAFTTVGEIDTHASSRWQVASDAGFSTVVDDSGIDAVNLVSYTVTSGVLESGNSYYARVMYTGATIGSSSWSAGSSFNVTGGEVPVSDIFSTTLYTGTGAPQTITNDIDLANEGGLVWLKPRASGSHYLFDTERGAGNRLQSDNTSAEDFATNTLTGFNDGEFTLGNNTAINANGSSYASWTFRKASSFFDVVEYTGDGVAGRQIPHNLGIAPGMVIVKNISRSNDWGIQHRSILASQGLLFTTSQALTLLDFWNSTYADANNVTLGDSGNVNLNGDQYIAYIFAHDVSDSGVIQCGSYVGNESVSGPIITLGWEPQLVLIKKSSGTGNWYIHDSARGSSAWLAPNLTNAEGTASITFNSTGFQITNAFSDHNQDGATFIYMAIRQA